MAKKTQSLKDTVRSVLSDAESPNKQVCLLQGEEAYLIHMTAKEVLARWVGADHVAEAVTIVEGDATPLFSIIGELRTASLFAEQQVYWVKDPSWLLVNRGREEKAALAEATASGFIAGNRLLITMSGKSDGRSAAVKAIDKHGIVATFQTPSEWDIGKLHKDEFLPFITKHLKKYSKRISDDALVHLRERVDNNLFALINAVDKVVAAIGDADEVTIAAIDDAIPKSRHDAIYALADDLAGKNADAALLKLRQFFLRGETPVAVHSYITGHVRALAATRQLIDGPLRGQVNPHDYRSFMSGIKSFQETAAQATPALAAATFFNEWGRPRKPFAAMQLFRQAQTVSLATCYDGLSRLHEIDVKLKSTSVDGRILLEDFVLRFCGRTSERRAS